MHTNRQTSPKYANMKEKVITVYCASSRSIDKVYFDAARNLGYEIARRGITLVDGGGSMGLMGAVNDAVIEAGGKAIGVIPEFMVDRGWHHRGLSGLHITDSMHSRKNKMASLADGVIALPGGIGTFEELLEIITWRKLGLFNGNVVIYNVDGYYDHLLAMLDTAIDQQFMTADQRAIWTVATSAVEAVEAAIMPPLSCNFLAKH